MSDEIKNKGRPLNHTQTEGILEAQKIRMEMIELEKKRTPTWLSSSQWDKITAMRGLCKDLNEANGSKYEFRVRPIIPYDTETVCGLFVPWNLQIIALKDERYDPNSLEVLKGSITIEEMYSGKTIKYNNKFIKGVQQVQDRVKKEDIVEFKSDTFKGKIKELRKKYNDDIGAIIKEILLDSDNRDEFMKYADKFLPYYSPKLANIEIDKKEKKDIKIEIIGLDMEKFKPIKTIETSAPGVIDGEYFENLDLEIDKDE
jgi:hypothetical protein